MARKPSTKSRKRTTPSKTESTPIPEGRLWFDEHGHLNQSGPVPLSRYLGELSDQLRLFLARLDSCERTDAGGYLLRDARAGNLGGMRVLWDNVMLLAQTSIAKTLPEMTQDQHTAMNRDEVFVTTTGPTRNAQPLADALRQLLFTILYNADGSWVSEIPSATVAKIRTIGNELLLHQTAWERSEGDTTRTPTVSVSPDLLDWLTRAAVADPHAIDRVAERAAAKAAEKMTHALGGNGNAAAKALPARTEVVLWEGAAHTDHNIRLARTRTAYLEAHGNVQAALAALKKAGDTVSRSTFYNHLKALDKEIPHWRESAQLSNPTGNLDGMRIVGTRGKSRGEVG
jgi:hypothetical protein